MNGKNTFCAAVAAVVLVAGAVGVQAVGQGKAAAAKSLRCTFSLNATGTWKKEGPPDATVKPAALVLIFESIEIDEGTAKLRNGSIASDVIARSSAGYLHFIQSFRGPLYTTTVFDGETSGGKLKAVHSRHEYFSVPLPGATSSPEQYYGECEVLK